MSHQSEEARPNKKAKIGTNAAADETPFDLLRKAINDKIDSLDAGCIIVCDIKHPIAPSDEEVDPNDYEEAEDDEYRTLSQEEIDSSFRAILTTKPRMAVLSMTMVARKRSKTSPGTTGTATTE